jgi:hypothetical protein
MDFLADADQAPDEVQDVEEAKRRFSAHRDAISRLAKELGERLEFEARGTRSSTGGEAK